MLITISRTLNFTKLLNKKNSWVVVKRWKKKKPKKTKPMSPTEKALHYFDTYYKPVFGDLWPSIRVSLLSGQKYGAVFNNFCQNETEIFLKDLGAKNMIEIARNVNKGSVKNHVPKVEDLQYSSFTDKNDIRLSDLAGVDPNLARDYDLHDFVPVQKVYTSREVRMQQEFEAGVFVDKSIDVKVKKDSEEMTLPENLKVFTFKPGNVSDFPRPKPDRSNRLGYYLLDASSILPVISLNIKPGERILDLCAAPGGKTLAMLQSLIPDVHITSNDVSASRLSRLKTILKFYVPQNHLYVETLCRDARKLSLPNSFDKVLVDVPCNCDRSSVLSDFNNLFSPIREEKRLKMSALQKDILVSGIQLCKPGGSIVYSTCTLSPPQNDGVIQAALEEVWQNTQIDICVEDISIITQQFKDTFTFSDKCKHGQLVIPSLTKNFGPMYIAKLNRIK